MRYTNPQLLIDNQWRNALGDRTLPVFNPATDWEIGRVAHASITDLDAALVAAQKGFKTWRAMPAIERCKIMHQAAVLMRERADVIAALMTQEQGKPLAEARAEALSAADIIDYFAEEGCRISPRAASVQQQVMKEPVGVVAAFTPWNFPINQRPIFAALRLTI